MRFFEVKGREIIPGIPVIVTDKGVRVDVDRDDTPNIVVDPKLLESKGDDRGNAPRLLEGGVGVIKYKRGLNMWEEYRLTLTPEDDDKRGDRVLVLYRFNFKSEIVSADHGPLDTDRGGYNYVAERSSRNHCLARSHRTTSEGPTTHDIAILLVMPAGEYIALEESWADSVIGKSNFRPNYLRLNYEGNGHFTFGNEHEAPGPAPLEYL